MANLEDIKGYPEFYKELLNDGMIYGSVGFDQGEGINYVLVEINTQIHTAELRMQKFGNGFRYSIYPMERDYIEDTAPFSCIGSFDNDTKETKIEKMTFALNHSSKAGFAKDDLTDENVVWATASTAKYIPAEIKNELEKEYEEAMADGESLKAFLEKNVQYFNGNPLVLHQPHFLEQDPMKFVKNFNEGYNLVEDMLYNNNYFTIQSIQEDPHSPTFECALNGVGLCKDLGLNSVRSEIWVTKNDILKEVPLQTPYASCYEHVVDANAREDRMSVSGCIKHLDIRYYNEGKQMHYNMITGVPEFYQIDSSGMIIGDMEVSKTERFGTFAEISKLNRDISNKAFEMIMDNSNLKDDLDEDELTDEDYLDDEDYPDDGRDF